MESAQYHVGAKLKEKDLKRIVAAVQPVMLPGERLTAVYEATRMRPMTIGVAVTSDRLLPIKFDSVREPIPGDDIVDVRVEKGTKLTIATSAGDQLSWTVYAEDAESMRQAVLAIAGRSSAVTAAHDAAQAHAAAEAAKVIGKPGDKVLQEVRANCRPGESPEFVVGAFESGLAAFTDRCMIVFKKSGFFSGMFATTFFYTDITAVESQGGFLDGSIEVLSASHPNSGPGSVNSVEVPIDVWEQARPHVDRMRELIAAAKRPVVQVQAVQASGPAFDLAAEIERVAQLHRSGVLDDDEFRAAKQALIARSAGG